MQDYYSRLDARHRKNRKRKKLQSTLITILAVILITGCLGGVLVSRFLPNFHTASVYTQIENLSEDHMNVVFNDELLALPHAPVFHDNQTQVYLPADLVKNFLDPYVFWEPDADKLTFTTEHKVIAMKTEELTYYVNNEPMQLSLPVFREGMMAYIPENFILQMYNVAMIYDETYNIVIIDEKDKVRTSGRTVRKTNMRFAPDKKSPIAEKLLPDTSMIVYGQTGDFTRVRLENGLIGYVATKDIGELTGIPPEYKSETPEAAPLPPIEGKIVLLWDQVFSAESSASLEKHQAVPTVNVLSPTWFSFDEQKLDTDIENVADIVNIGDIGYVQAAHANGCQVWPLISDNFNQEISHAILTDPDNRARVIKQLLAFIGMYHLDGINIDFEAVSQADAPYYLQFLRELNPLLKQQGAILSVDMFVPLYTKYYNRTEVAKVVDYICVMTYDEHYSGSETTGPVASLGFVDVGIGDTLLEAPKEKVLMGLPFYVRMWTEWEEDGVISFYKTDTTMQNAYNVFTQNNASFEWLEDIGCYYGEYSTLEDGKTVTKKVWLEDETSIAAKLEIARQYDLAGVACWKRGLEKPTVWEYIRAYTRG